MKYLYDGDNVIVDLNAENKATAFYVTPFLDQYVSKTIFGEGDAAATYYYTQDGLGSVRALTDSTGKAANLNDYFAFGEVNENALRAGIANRYTYTGRESALASLSSAPMYYRWRMYESSQGRFIARDPIGFLGDMGGNIYFYVGGQATNFMDPYGLEEIGIAAVLNKFLSPDSAEKLWKWIDDHRYVEIMRSWDVTQSAIKKKGLYQIT